MSNHEDDLKQAGFNEALRQALKSLYKAADELRSLSVPNKQEVIGDIGMAVGHIINAGATIPGFSMGDENETPVADGPLSEEELYRVGQLSDDDLHSIDEALLAQCNHQFRKVARVVGFAVIERSANFEGIPDTFYSQRVTKLVQSGRLEHQGQLGYMRFCEVRLPSADQ